jgi:UDP-N-acetylmuramate--alanine ligase
VHFVGIGGIGMSGIAEVLHNLGYRCRAPTWPRTPTCSACARTASTVAIGHEAENLGDAEVVVVSSAIKRDNPELAARARLPAGRAPRRDAGRADALQARHRHRRHPRQDHDHLAGRGAARCRRQYDPTVINGGIINAYGTNARLGAGDWMVVEADESDGTFVKLPADVAIVTNIDPEHLDHYGSFDKVRDAFSNSSRTCRSTASR